MIKITYWLWMQNSINNSSEFATMSFFFSIT